MAWYRKKVRVVLDTYGYFEADSQGEADFHTVGDDDLPETFDEHESYEIEDDGDSEAEFVSEN